MDNQRKTVLAKRILIIASLCLVIAVFVFMCIPGSHVVYHQSDADSEYIIEYYNYFSIMATGSVITIFAAVLTIIWFASLVWRTIMEFTNRYTTIPFITLPIAAFSAFMILLSTAITNLSPLNMAITICTTAALTLQAVAMCIINTYQRAKRVTD